MVETDVIHELAQVTLGCFENYLKHGPLDSTKHNARAEFMKVDLENLVLPIIKEHYKTIPIFDVSFLMMGLVTFAKDFVGYFNQQDIDKPSAVVYWQFAYLRYFEVMRDLKVIS